MPEIERNARTRRHNPDVSGHLAERLPARRKHHEIPAVLHDENSNSKMDFNFLGMPLEGYGFSRDAPVTFGPPSFDDAAIRLVARHSRASIRLRYFWR